MYVTEYVIPHVRDSWSIVCIYNIVCVYLCNCFQKLISFLISDTTSPYLGAYGGVSPAYSNIGSSPQYMPIQPTPPPDLMYQYQPNIGSSPQYPGAVSPQAQAQVKYFFGI